MSHWKWFVLIVFAAVVTNGIDLWLLAGGYESDFPEIFYGCVCGLWWREFLK